MEPEVLGPTESYFDGWENQCFGKLADNGAHCAYGWLRVKHPEVEVDDIMVRIGLYVQSNYVLPATHDSGGYMPNQPRINAHHATLYANDVLRLTPADFRRIDILTRERQ